MYSDAMHAMSVKRSQIFKALACCQILAAGTTCLPNAIPEDQRQNITVDGVSMPLGIVVVDSCLVSGKVLKCFERFSDGQGIPRLILNMQSQNEKQDVWFSKFHYF